MRDTNICGFTLDQNYAYKDYPKLMIENGRNGYSASETPAPSTESPQQRVVDTALSQVGYVAENGKHTKYAQELDAIGDIYNGPKDGYDWCDVFVD